MINNNERKRFNSNNLDAKIRKQFSKLSKQQYKDHKDTIKKRKMIKMMRMKIKDEDDNQEDREDDKINSLFVKPTIHYFIMMIITNTSIDKQSGSRRKKMRMRMRRERESGWWMINR